MAVVITNDQWTQLTQKLDRILAELMVRQPVDANIQKRLLELETAVQKLQGNK